VVGADTQVIFNDGGTTFAGDAGFTYNKTTNIATLTGGINVGDGTISSDCLGLFSDQTLDTTIGFVGLCIDITKTAGSTDLDDDLFNALFALNLNHNGSTVGTMYGLWHRTKVQDGTATAITGHHNEVDISHATGIVTGDIKCGYDFCDLNTSGTIGGDIYGRYIDMDIDSTTGTITGSVYGLYISADIDKNPGGLAYMLYINDVTSNIDYGIYQNGVSPNYLGGALTVTGTLTANGTVNLGDASTELLTCTGRLLVRSVNAESMNMEIAGTEREIAYNDGDSHFYGCTVTGAIGAATWVLLG